MIMMRTLALTSLLALLTTGHAPAGAVALRQEKATDASICDLGPNTNPVLARRVLIPADASSKDQVDAYFRLGASFVAGNCSNGQVLILHGNSSEQVDIESLSQVANSACTVASIARTELPYTYAGRSKPGFELRCNISKRDDLVQKLADLERIDPMDSLKARMYAAVQQAEQGSGPSGTSSQGKKDCSKVTLASLLQGGSCK